MTDEELIARLRKCGNGIGSFKTNQGDYGLCDDAADRIEALVKGLDDAIIKRAAWELEAKVQQARAERLEAALREILEKPRNADLTYAELFAEVVSEARAALKGADHDR